MSDTTNIEIEINEIVASLFDIKNAILYIQKYIAIANENISSFDIKDFKIDDCSMIRNFNLMFDIYNDCYMTDMKSTDIYSLMKSLHNINLGNFPNKLYDKCKSYLKTIENEILPKINEHYNKLLEYIKTTDFNERKFMFRECQSQDDNLNSYDLKCFYDRFFEKDWNKHFKIVDCPVNFGKIRNDKQKQIHKIEYLRKITNDYNLIQICKCYDRLLNHDNQIQQIHLLAPWRYKFMLIIDESIFNSQMSIEDIIDKNYNNINDTIRITITKCNKPTKIYKSMFDYIKKVRTEGQLINEIYNDVKTNDKPKEINNIDDSINNSLNDFLFPFGI